MLESLKVLNLAVVESATAEFVRGLNVITGETGAGKSVLMGALELVTGGRAEAELVREGAKEAEVEARFGEREVRRTVNAEGRSRCWIDGESVTVAELKDFCRGIVSRDLPRTSYFPGAVSAPLHELLPEAVSSRLRKVFPMVDRKIHGYYTNEALLLGVESRTSSPVRIPRDPDTLQSPELPGLYPCGEGAGYSGGIVSSALDGIRCARAIATQ